VGDLVKEGLIWRVGNGDGIRIWGDRWLPSKSTFMIQSVPNTFAADSKVSALIEQDLHT
jgi:hypothetical protein